MTEEPLIWTSKGNLPIKDLSNKAYWEFDENGVTFVEEYYLGEELVKRSAHRYQHSSLEEVTGQGIIGG